MATINPADFTPTRGSYIDLSPFRYWCQKVLPLVYDDSLSYYELLNKVVDYLNKTMEDVTTLNGDVTAMYEAYVSLQEYVNTYFDSLDVQEEINNKLNAMALDGSLSHIIEPLIPDSVSDWLEENLEPTEPPVDATLSISGAAADAKVTGDKFDELDEYIASFTEPATSMFKTSDVTIGVDWQGNTNPARAVMYISANPNTTYYYDFTEMGAFITASAIEKDAQDSTVAIASHPLEYSKGSFTTNADTRYICIQLGKGSVAITNYDLADFKAYFGTVEYYVSAIDIKARNDIAEINNTLSDVTETSTELVNLYDFSKVVIGKNWLNQDNPARAIMYIPASPNTTYYYDFRDMGVFLQASAVEKTTEDSGSAIVSHALERTEGRFTTSDTTGVICIQFGKGSFHISASDFNDYNPYFALESATNLYSADKVTIGYDWQGSSNPNRAVMYVNANPNTTYYYDFRNKGNFVTISAVEKTSRESVAAIVSHPLEGFKGSFTTSDTTAVICLQFGKGSFPITSEDFADYVPYFGLTDYYVSAIDKAARKYSNCWEGKSMVWLGTSIPAAGKYNVKNSKSYPIMVGNILNADVYNEAVGSSALHCKEPSRISTNNPYGFIDNFEAASRCITNSLEEMEWIINHFNDTNVFTLNVPSSLSDADKNFIRSCSWENKLGKYFNSDMFPDVWVIDHGHNDIPTTASEDTYYAKSSMNGTQHNGYYSAGNFVSSNASSYFEYDVTNELFVWISGTFGAWYDAVDLYDANDNLLRYVRYASETTINQLKIDVSKATKLRVSDPNTMVNTISVQKSTYPTYNSLYSYQGGFDFIVNKILTYNPKARIVMIGEYENQKYPSISENQVIASERWELPLFEQWKNTGWSQQPILVDGSYVSVLNANIPDNLHPHSDTTGKALERMANNIAMWLTTIG